MRVLSVVAGALATVASFADPSDAGIVTFGSGANQLSMTFVTIGNPGNAADTTGIPNPAGAVGYTYDIGKFEVSRDMITKYNTNIGTGNSLAISLADMSGRGGNGVNRPATGITWNEAARFVNWLNTSKGFAPAYKYANTTITTNLTPWTVSDTLDYDASNLYRSKRANFFLPSFNEWYKAAYYDPNKSGADKYWDYPQGSDSIPTQTTGGTTRDTAVYGYITNYSPADVTNAGGLSPYGVMGLGGNVTEWEESSVDLSNSDGSSNRGWRGGSWIQNASFMGSSYRRTDFTPNGEDNELGFRVASYNSDAVVPEPSMMVIGMVFGLGGLAAKRRLKK